MMLKRFATVTLTTLTVLMLGSLAIHAQESNPGSSDTTETTTVSVTNLAALGRAQNLARQAAEKMNGGLNRYRADRSMYGPPSQAPFKENPDGSFTFTFQGYTPGSDVPSYQTVVTVSQDGQQVSVNSNEPAR